jgi:diacylglycerol O-acyltransferase / wax synthase
MSSRERVSPVDIAWLRMDRPHNLMQILGVMLFDGELDLKRLKRAIQTRMLIHRRFVQCVVTNHEGYWWKDDPRFDLDNHLHRAALPGAAGKAELQDFVSRLASQPLDRHRPLWEFHLVDTALGGQALIMRIHHCIADGIALVGVIMSLMGQETGKPRRRLPRASHNGPEADAGEGLWNMLWHPIEDALHNPLRASGDLLAKYADLVSHPGQLADFVRLGGDLAVEMGKLAFMASDSPTRFKGKPGALKRLAWSARIPLTEVKALGQVLGCSVNDLLLSAVAGALRAYLVAQGDAVDGVELRAMVPVNLRRPQDEGKLGNRFGLVALVLPVGIENPLARLQETRVRMARLKDSYQAALTLTILGAVGMAPKIVQSQVLDLLARKATAVMTNVPGPREALYLAGARMTEPLFWVPQSGDIGIGVSILSYDGAVQVGLITDDNLVPDPEAIVAGFAREFERLMLLVLMEPWDRLKDPEAVEAALAAELR